MAENETVLLERFSTRADADAFAELVRRYAQMSLLASVHTAFSTEKTTWLPGESLMLTAHLRRRGERWQVFELNAGPFEADEDDAG